MLIRIQCSPEPIRGYTEGEAKGKHAMHFFIDQNKNFDHTYSKHPLGW